MAASTAKQMQKLNSKLDKILEKHMEMPETDNAQEEARTLIAELKWDEAAAFCSSMAKSYDKSVKLKGEEKELRSQLEQVRADLETIAAGGVPEKAEEPQASTDAATITTAEAEAEAA